MDVILLDLGLPDLDGVEIIKKSAPGEPEIYITHIGVGYRMLKV